MKATEKTYLRAWKQEIRQGVELGRLTKVMGYRADLRSFTSYIPEAWDAPMPHQEAAE